MPNFCINCGNKLESEWEYCKQCGQRVNPQQESQPTEKLQRYRVPKQGLGKVKVTSTSYYSSKRTAIAISFIVIGFLLFFVSILIISVATTWPMPLVIGISIILLVTCLVLGLLLWHFRELD